MNSNTSLSNDAISRIPVSYYSE